MHDVVLNEFFMSKFEITNAQYCDYLDSACCAQLKVVSNVMTFLSGNVTFLKTATDCLLKPNGNMQHAAVSTIRIIASLGAIT